MSPFIGSPHGISAESLELLDRALSSIWRDELLKSELARAKAAHRSGDQSTPDKPIAPARRRPRAWPAKL